MRYLYKCWWKSAPLAIGTFSNINDTQNMLTFTCRLSVSPFLISLTLSISRTFQFITFITSVINFLSQPKQSFHIPISRSSRVRTPFSWKIMQHMWYFSQHVHLFCSIQLYSCLCEWRELASRYYCTSSVENKLCSHRRYSSTQNVPFKPILSFFNYKC